MIEQEQALLVAKQRFRDAQDELEELRSLTQDQNAQLEDYRNKYLIVCLKIYNTLKYNFNICMLSNIKK